MPQLKRIVILACLSLVFVASSTAQAGWRNRYGYYRVVGPPVYVYPPVVAPPPPVVVGPAYAYPPVYGPPVYRYGVFGRRAIVVGAPGVGVYVGP
jgi:hypothetical protein